MYVTGERRGRSEKLLLVIIAAAATGVSRFRSKLTVARTRASAPRAHRCDIIIIIIIIKRGKNEKSAQTDATRVIITLGMVN